MKILARALGAAVIGVLFTVCLGALLVLHVAKVEEEERRAQHA